MGIFTDLRALARKQFSLLTLTAVLLVGCAHYKPVAIEPIEAPCPRAFSHHLTWAGPLKENRQKLSAWCRSVGPIDFSAPPEFATVDLATSGLIVVTWNTHVGYGRLEAFLKLLPRQAAKIILLQEVGRKSEEVPLCPPAGVTVPHRIGPCEIQDIAAIARDFNMSLIYVPSMGNGAGTQEDRGCAILSSLPLSDIVGIELPWLKQRHVAIMATAVGKYDGADWPFRIMSVHFDTPPRRSPQAAPLAEFIARQNQEKPLPTIVGGDLNSWFGVWDAAVKKIDHVVPRIHECGNRMTFRVLHLPLFRLDHLFTTLPTEARSGCVIQTHFFESDHRPMVLYLFKPMSEIEQKNIR